MLRFPCLVALCLSACASANIGVSDLKTTEKDQAVVLDLGDDGSMPAYDLTMPPTGCTSNGDCVDAGVCNTSTNLCVGCLTANDCPAPLGCTNNVCTSACTVTSNCGIGGTCCNSTCVDLTSNASHCGACGTACDTKQSTGAACANSTCTYTGCAPGFADCTTTAPDSDGCETETYAPAHCGTSNAACTNMCSFANASATCPAGTCELSACSSGYYDCDGNATNGCEAAGPTTAPGCCTGSTPSTSGTAQADHTDGLGHTFWNCVALGTYTLAEAQAAATAYDPTGAVDPTDNHYSDSKGTVDYICNVSTVNGSGPCWTWAATGTYAAAVGMVYLYTPLATDNCYFPVGTGFPEWK